MAQLLFAGSVYLFIFLVQAEALVKAQQDIEETMGQLGLAFIRLVKLENDKAVYDSQRTRAADAKHVATASVKTSRLYRELNSQIVKHLVIMDKKKSLISMGVQYWPRSKIMTRASMFY